MVSSLLKLTFAGAVVGFLGYCVYFDRKRRSDPDYRDKVLKRRKAKALAAQKASMPSLPPMNDPRAIHRFFLNQIQQGETALTYGFTNEAVQHFAYAIVVCSQPTQLLQVLQQTLSPGVFKQLLATIPSVRQLIKGVCNPSGISPVEEDLE